MHFTKASDAVSSWSQPRTSCCCCCCCWLSVSDGFEVTGTILDAVSLWVTEVSICSHELELLWPVGLTVTLQHHDWIQILRISPEVHMISVDEAQWFRVFLLMLEHQCNSLCVCVCLGAPVWSGPQVWNVLAVATGTLRMKTRINWWKLRPPLNCWPKWWRTLSGTHTRARAALN